jgi:hypothetical protein
VVSDLHQPKLDIASHYPGITPGDITKRDLLDAVKGETELSQELEFGRTRVGRLGSRSGRGRCPPVLQRLPSEDAERRAGNKMALTLNVFWTTA